MKNKDNQRLLQFPSVFNLEPGGKSEVKPVEDPAAPEWKKEVSKKVEEHRRMKELQENIQGLKNLSKEPLPPQEVAEEKARLTQRFTPSAESAPALLKEGLKDEKLREKLQFPHKSAPPVPAPPADAPPAGGQLKDKLADTHRQLFKDADLTLEEELRAIEAQPSPSFDELNLTKNPTPGTADWEDEITILPEPTPAVRGDRDMPLGELLERYRSRPDSATPAARGDRTVLVSRVLAGLIDLLVVMAMSLLLLALVAFSTHQPFFTRSIGLLGLLFLILNQFVYSFYFLFLWRKTLGMSVVGLEVRFHTDPRQSPGAVLLRTTFFILAVACLGIGLIWGIFDREAKCWQDILSDSSIVRVP